VNLLEKYKLVQKHYFIIILFAVILLLFISSFIFFIRKIQFAERYNNDFITLKNYYYELTNIKTDLLENDELTDDFYNSGVDNHLLIFTEQYDLFYKKITEISQNKRTRKFSFTDQIKKISDDIIIYNQSIKEIFTLEQTIGNKNSGIKKNLLFSKNQIEEIFNEENIDIEIKKKINYLFELETSFETTKNIIYYNEFEKKYSDFNNSSLKIDTSNIYKKYINTKIQDLLAEYKDNFIIKFEKRVAIGLSNTEGLLGELNDKEQILYENIIQLIEDNTLKNKLNLLSLYLYTIILSIVFLTIIILIVAYISSYYNRNISEINNKITILSTGELVLENENKLKDEFGTINNKIEQISSGTMTKILFAQKIKEKDFNANLELLSNNDLLGKSLIDLKDSLQKSEEEAQFLKKADDIQDWKTLGLAKFGEVMRKSTDNLQQLSREVIKNLIDYVEASQGGFYIYNDENQNNIFLELTAQFAYGKEKITNKQIALYEGLIGTCAVEKNKFYFEKIPDEYIYISSGFGQAKPQSLIIMPLIVDKNIYGVIELASLRKFHDYELDFLDKLATDIAITVSYVKINDETARFLKMSERQTRKLLRKQHESQEQIVELEKNLDLTSKKLMKKEQILKVKDELITEKIKDLSKALLDYKNKDNQFEKVSSELKQTLYKSEENFKFYSKEKTELLNKITLLESEIQHLKDLKNDEKL